MLILWFNRGIDRKMAEQFIITFIPSFLYLSNKEIYGYQEITIFLKQSILRVPSFFS